MMAKKGSLSDLENRFSRAADHLQSLVASLDSGQLLGFYGLYKQATVGPCDTPKPSWYQAQAKQKWEAWRSLGSMGKAEAMEKYVSALKKLNDNWEDESKIGGRAWVAVSSMVNTDDTLNDGDKTLLDWVKEGNEDKVRETLMRNSSIVNSPDESNMLPIHWAADRGHMLTIKCLIERGADIDAQDNDGQTPLHYAASCGHADVVEYLLSIGAKSLKDHDGLTPKQVADERLAAVL
ncbi:acyl-CoA-binding domain-containing protein 6 [Fopius arisanus]|uniref:Acyl-CoA-binding domain-containing protein 6 n=1 Tax=Fopius arisanus TaxID=64838 RepID=A0A9R1TYH0_9HYME|nr:PREDICTED: acyl-CoA-binding domain-containing protein 6 [Fopius arisanus]